MDVMNRLRMVTASEKKKILDLEKKIGGVVDDSERMKQKVHDTIMEEASMV